MTIIQTVDFNAFAQAFRNFNRQDNFTYDGLQLLFEGLENLAEETGEPIELDVIALCCEFTEYTIPELLEAYPEHAEELAETDEQESIEAWVEVLNEAGYVLNFDDERLIYQG